MQTRGTIGLRQHVLQIFMTGRARQLTAAEQLIFATMFSFPSGILQCMVHSKPKNSRNAPNITAPSQFILLPQLVIPRLRVLLTCPYKLRSPLGFTCRSIKSPPPISYPSPACALDVPLQAIITIRFYVSLYQIAVCPWALQ